MKRDVSIFFSELQICEVQIEPNFLTADFIDRRCREIRSSRVLRRLGYIYIVRVVRVPSFFPYFRAPSCIQNDPFQVSKKLSVGSAIKTL